MEYQTVMACVSDMDLSQIYPQLHADPLTPLLTMATWEPERLQRMARWKQMRGEKKDLIRAYAKAILALSDLHDSAVCLQLPTTAAKPGGHNSTRVIRNSKIGSTSSDPASSHALAPCRDNALSSAVARAPAVPPPGVEPPESTWFLRPPSDILRAPPTRVVHALRSWRLMLVSFANLGLEVLQWLPIIFLFLVGAVAVVLTDPALILTLLWHTLSLIPAAIRDRLAAPAAQSPTPILPQHHYRQVTAVDATPPPAFAHPYYAEPTQVGPLGVAMSVLAAQGGGAGLLYWLVTTGRVQVAAPSQAA